MARWRSLLLTVTPLVTAGLAFGVLGARAIRLEQTEARRAAEERAEAAVTVAAALLPQAARELTTVEEIRRDDGPGLALPTAPALDENRTLLVAQAEYLEQTGDLEGAAKTWTGLAAFGPGAPLDAAGALCLVRAGALRARLSQTSAARGLFDTILAARLPPEADGAKALALRHLFRLSTGAERSDLVRRLLAATDEGRVLRFDGAPDRGDLLIAVRREVEADPRPLDAEARLALAKAADRAERGHRLLAALHGGPIGVVDRHVGWLAPGGATLVLAAPRDLERALATRVGHPIRLADAAERRMPGERAAKLGAPTLAALDVRTMPFVGLGAGGGPSLAWVALGSGLLLFALGGTFAVLALRRAEHAARMQSDFVAAVSHEMKTPIAGVQAMAEMLAEGRVSEPGKAVDYAERIRAEMGRLGSTVRDVLDVSRIERDPTALVRPARSTPPGWSSTPWPWPDPPSSDGGSRSGPRSPPPRRPSPSTPTPWPTSCTTCSTTRPSSRPSGRRSRSRVRDGPGGRGGRGPRRGGYRIEVSDRGPGIPEDDRARVFERFFRGEDARHRAVPGVGLGLHVAREIVRAHGGNDRLFRAFGRRGSLRDRPSGRGRVTASKILIVEDDESLGLVARGRADPGGLPRLARDATARRRSAAAKARATT